MAPDGEDPALAAPSPTDPCKKAQQALFKEAAAGGFTRLLRSMSPKRMFSPRPSSASGSPSAGVPTAPLAPPAAAAANRASGAAAGALQWPPLAPAANLGTAASSPEAASSSPTRYTQPYKHVYACRVASVQPQKSLVWQ